MKPFFSLITAALVFALPGLVIAQDFPSRPIRLLVGFPPGGNSDLVARIVAQEMSEGLGQQVVVENRTGAGSIIANEYVAKSAPDGYTLIVITGAYVAQVATLKKLPYDPIRDFAWVSMMASYPLVLAVRPDSQFKTLRDFIAYAKRNPGKLNYPSPGIGTSYHLAAEMFSSMAGIEMTHVPFRGGSEPMTELLAGRMDLIIDALPFVYQQIQAGKLRALAVSSLEPSATLSHVPTVAQSVPAYEARSFLGIAAPGSTPQTVVDRLNREVRRALALPDIHQRFAKWGAAPRASSPEEMRELVASEIAKWKQVVNTRKIEVR